MLIVNWYLSDLFACGHIRGELIAREINKHFPNMLINCKTDILMSDFYKTNVMVFQRQSSMDILDKMKIARNSGIKCIYELDDDMFNMPPEFDKPYKYYSQPHVQKAMDMFLMNADEITTTTKTLADTIRHRTLGQKIHVVPNYIDIDNWQEGYIAKMENPSDDVTIGWMASGSHQIDASIISDTLHKLMLRHKNVKLQLIGWIAEEQFPWLADFKDRVIMDAWIDISILPLAMAKFDIGLAPLADNTFNKSKSNIKFLQYSALGAPCVASPLPPYSEDIVNGVNGFLANSPEDWEEYLERLITDRPFRMGMATEARKLLVNKYDIRLNISRWIEIFDGIVKDKR